MRTIGGLAILLVAVYLLGGGSTEGLAVLIGDLLGTLVDLGADIARHTPTGGRP
jgi:hypothetical protein